MNYCLDSVYDLLTMPFFSFTLGDKLDEIKNLAVQEEEYVFNLECALAEPGISVHVKLLGDARLKLTTLVVVGSLLSRVFSSESIFWHLVEAEEVIIELIIFLDFGRLGLLLSKSEFLAWLFSLGRIRLTEIPRVGGLGLAVFRLLIAVFALRHCLFTLVILLVLQLGFSLLHFELLIYSLN